MTRLLNLVKRWIEDWRASGLSTYQQWKNVWRHSE